MYDHKNNYGAVVIGRNEADRLESCLNSVVKNTNYIVYVDSGSTDNSLNIARNLRIESIELDMSIPFTAARARNIGFKRLLELNPGIEYVQFIDGDCEVVIDWFAKAITYLDKHQDIAVICGRRRERFPDKSVYNLLCDMEWNTPVGSAKACGGDAMYRITAFTSVGGYNQNLIAGEEPELCVRLRKAGWLVWRLDAEMTLHDANILHFGQWWRRSIRAGYAFAEGVYFHGFTREKYRVRESMRIWLWGILLPISIIFLTFINACWLLLSISYLIQIIRISLKRGKLTYINIVYAFYLMLGKLPEGIGQLKYIFNRIFSRQNSLIEYK